MAEKGTKLADAYVQIIPSAKGIKGKLTSVLSGEASAAGDAAGVKFTDVLKKAIATAGIGATITNSLLEGADLQQSLGGIETLFKDSADKVIANAKEAYRTAGLSANEYMESVTGFSASLLQGLSGDTNKAADVAHMALTDMSDNANKMGTSMELIQNAYGGLAKANYTMLDNLKLGYGGTKEEMQRLLADATKLSGVEYDISNLADVYNAIHVIQEEMGITGTTAKEASETFSGSLAAMKAAFSNVLGNLAIGEELNDSLGALLDTTFIFLKGNLFPMIGNILSGIPEVLETATSFVVRGLNMINAQEVIQSGIALVTQLTTGILYNIPFLLEAGAKLVLEFSKAIINTDWLAVATDTITNLKKGIDNATGQILGSDETIISSLFQGIINYLPVFQENISRTFALVWEACKTVWEQVGQPITEAIMSAFGYVVENWDSIAKTIGDVFQVLWDTCQLIWDSVGKPIWDGVCSIIQEVSALFSEYMPKIMDFFQVMVSGIKDTWDNHLKPVFEIIGDFLKTILTPNFEFAFNEVIKPLIENVFGFIVDLWNTVLKPAFDGICDFLTGVFTGNWGLAFEGISQIVTSALDGIATIFQTCFLFLEEIASKIWNSIKAIWSDVAGWFNENVIQPLVEFFTDLWTDLQTIWDSICDVVSIALQLIGSIISAAFQIITLPFQFIWQNCKDVIFEVWEEIKTTISNSLNDIKTHISGVLSEIKEKVTFIWDKIAENLSNVWNDIKEKIDICLEEIKNVVSIAFESVKTKTSSIFESIKTNVQNVWNGIKTTISDKVDSIKTKISSVFESVKTKVSDVFNGIKSTASTVWGNIKKAITEPIEKAKDVVKEAIDKIKGFFKFEVSLPNIKLPHFSIKPKGWELGDLMDGTIPKLGIEWYAKAVNRPMIMDSPTAFGINSLGQLRVGGETKSEVVSGTDTLMRMIAEAVASQNEAVIYCLEELISILLEYLPQIATETGDVVVKINEKELFRVIKNEARNYTRKTGRVAFD